MNWVLAAVGILILICVIVGICKGAIKIAVSIGAAILTLVLVFFVTPYVSKGIAALTPLDEMIESQVGKAISGAAGSVLEDKSAGMTSETVTRVLEAAGVTAEDLKAAGISVKDIVNGKIDSEDLAQYGISRSLLDGLNVSQKNLEDSLEELEIPRDMQMKAIEDADLPDVFKNLLETNNNSEIYKSLGVNSFVQYIGKYLSALIINIVAFLLTFILVTIILRAIIFALDIIANLPVLGFVNRFAGGIIGMFGALIIIWIVFIVITLLYTTDFGRETYALIQGDTFLKVLYEYNPIMKLATMLK